CDTAVVSARGCRAPPFVVIPTSAIASCGRGSGSQRPTRIPGRFLDHKVRTESGQDWEIAAPIMATATGGCLMKFKTLGVASSLAIMCCLAAPAYAQNEAAASNEETSRNEVITVTAQFREQNLQDTPIAITAMNAEMLEARGHTNIAQVAANAPNVSLTPQPQNGGTGLIAYIRGVGQTDFNYALDPGVGIYIDDVYIPTLSSSLLELIDLDRIEILRGPQGTLAGKNSIGGAIKLFSAEPRGDGSGSLAVTYGSFDRVEVRGMAD